MRSRTRWLEILLLTVVSLGLLWLVARSALRAGTCAARGDTARSGADR